MFEGPSFDHLKSTNQQAFAVATLRFWVYQQALGVINYQDFKGIYKSKQNNDYMFE